MSKIHLFFGVKHSIIMGMSEKNMKTYRRNHKPVRNKGHYENGVPKHAPRYRHARKDTLPLIEKERVLTDEVLAELDTAVDDASMDSEIASEIIHAQNLNNTGLVVIPKAASKEAETVSDDVLEEVDSAVHDAFVDSEIASEIIHAQDVNNTAAFVIPPFMRKEPAEEQRTEAETETAVKENREEPERITSPEKPARKTETADVLKSFLLKIQDKLSSMPWFVLMTGILIYDELILHKTAGFPFTAWTLLAVVLFSGFWAALLDVLTKLIPAQKPRYWVRLILTALISLLFLVCFFVHKQFKVFYDLSTMTAGAGDALGQFQANVMAMIFSADGMFKIFLYALPVALYAFVGRKSEKDPAVPKKKLVSLLTCAAMLVGSVGSTYISPAWGTFTSEYNFQNAICSFGLLSAFALDAKKLILPDLGFEPTLTKLIHTTEEGNQQLLEWNRNELDFDWSALAETADKTQASLDAYVASQTASRKNDYTGLFEGKNLIMITAEAFTAEVIDEERTPTLYRLATKGINFTDYYQPASAGTTGGEYEIVFGMLPTNGGSSFKNTANYTNYMTMGSQLGRLGYEGWAFHNNTYTFYDRHLTHVNLGYNHGFMAYGNGMEEYVRWRWPQSDLEMFEGTMPLYENEDLFNVYYMTVSGHNSYSLGGNAMTKENWDLVQDMDASDSVKGYIACNLELEKALTYMVNRLEELGKADDTVIVISADHFPYGLDYDAGLGAMPYLSELYGHNVTDYLDRDHNRLIIWSGCLEDEEPIIVDTPTSSLDILPTLSNLFGTEFDSRLFPGRDVFSDAEPLVFELYYDWKTNLGTYNSVTNVFTPNEGVTVPDGYEERIRKIIRNKIQYCTGYNNTDYFGHLFGNN